mgnify:CR=1 FL=1
MGLVNRVVEDGEALADRVIAPAVMGGRLMAAAAESQSVPWYVEQVIGKGWTDRLEHRVTATEAGKTVEQLPDFHDVLVLGISRPPDMLCDHLDTTRLHEGDTVIYYRLQVQDAVERRQKAAETKE